MRALPRRSPGLEQTGFGILCWVGQSIEVPKSCARSGSGTSNAFEYSKLQATLSNACLYCMMIWGELCILMYFAVFCGVVFFGMQQSIAASCIWTKAPCQLRVPSDQLALPQQTPAGSRERRLLEDAASWLPTALLACFLLCALSSSGFVYHPVPHKYCNFAGLPHFQTCPCLFTFALATWFTTSIPYLSRLINSALMLLLQWKQRKVMDRKGGRVLQKNQKN